METTLKVILQLNDSHVLFKRKLEEIYEVLEEQLRICQDRSDSMNFVLVRRAGNQEESANAGPTLSGSGEAVEAEQVSQEVEAVHTPAEEVIAMKGFEFA